MLLRRADSAHYIGEVEYIVRRTLPRAPTAPRRAWLSRSPHDAPGERPSSTPRTALTAAPRSVLRPPAAQLARAHPETASRAAAPHHVPVAVSSPTPRTVPDPSRYPVHAADSQHTRSSARPVPPSIDLKPPCRAATSTATVTRLESRRTSRRDGAYKYYANYILSPQSVMYFWIFMTVSRYFLRTFLETAMIFPNITNSAELHTTSRNSLRDLRRSFPKLRRNLPRFSDTENIDEPF